MPVLPKLTLQSIRRRFDEQDLERGVRYFEDDMIYRPWRAGPVLRARCHGMSGGPYAVWAEFWGRGLKAADCSCPVGDGGGCKHVVALLLTWIERPETFLVAESIDAVLKDKSREELIELIKDFALYYPELELIAQGVEIEPDDAEQEGW